MKPLNLQEFAEELRLKGDSREIDFADMILQLLDIEEAVAEPYSDLCSDLEHYVPKAENPQRALEELGDRSTLLKEIEDALAEADRKPQGTSDAGDEVKALLADLEDVAEILKGEGWDGTGDIAEALRHTLANWPPKLEYDL